MTELLLELRQNRERLGLKGPRAGEWLVANAVAVPTSPNTWMPSQEPPAGGTVLVARLGASEFFLEAQARDEQLTRVSAALERGAVGVYCVPREDWCLDLVGEGLHEVLAQVCNVNFAAASLEGRPAIMTLMIGVAVLVVRDAEHRVRIWCDPTFGPYLSESLGKVVAQCGGRYRGDIA